MTKPGRLELDIEQLDALLDRIEQHTLVETDYPLIADLIRSIAWLSQTLENQSITIHRLRKIFGFKTEHTKNLPDINPENSTPGFVTDVSQTLRQKKRKEILIVMMLAF